MGELINKLYCIVLVVQRLDNAIHRINHYPVDNVVCFVNTYLLDSDLSRGQRYPAFEQPRPGLLETCVEFGAKRRFLLSESAYFLCRTALARQALQA